MEISLSTMVCEFNLMWGGRAQLGAPGASRSICCCSFMVLLSNNNTARGKLQCEDTKSRTKFKKMNANTVEIPHLECGGRDP